MLVVGSIAAVSATAEELRGPARPAPAARSSPRSSHCGRPTTPRRPARRSRTARSARAAGIAAITARQVDFGASDAPLSPDQLNACNGCVQIPWALSATSIIYNVKDVPNNLHMTGAVLANIYLGTITKWNDPAIKALNPKTSLPATSITPVYRSDNSGTTYNFTDYLSKVSPGWKSKIGIGVNANWPAGQGGRGSAGVSGIVSNTDGALGYVDVAFALKNRLKFMSIRNSSGKYTTPGLRGITAAAGTVKSVPASNELHIVNPPKSDPLAYPICTFTYVILPLKATKRPTSASSSSTPSIRRRARSSGRNSSSRRCRSPCSSRPRRR